MKKYKLPFAKEKKKNKSYTQVYCVNNCAYGETN